MVPEMQAPPLLNEENIVSPYKTSSIIIIIIIIIKIIVIILITTAIIILCFYSTISSDVQTHFMANSK